MTLRVAPTSLQNTKEKVARQCMISLTDSRTYLTQSSHPSSTLQRARNDRTRPQYLQCSIFLDTLKCVYAQSSPCSQPISPASSGCNYQRLIDSKTTKLMCNRLPLSYKPYIATQPPIVETDCNPPLKTSSRFLHDHSMHAATSIEDISITNMLSRSRSSRSYQNALVSGNVPLLMYVLLAILVFCFILPRHGSWRASQVVHASLSLNKGNLLLHCKM
jgi:hypothetical protein